MISLLCQKSHSGVISTNQEGYSQTYISALFKEDNEESVKSEENGGDYEFLRRFPSSTKSTTNNRQLGTSARSKTIKSAPTSVISSSTYYVMTTPAASHKAAKKAVQHLDKSNGEKETPSTQRTVTFDPRQQAVQDYYTQHPFRRLSSKKLRSVQKWIEQRLSEDPANLEFYNKLNDLLKREKELIKEINESLERCDAIELTRKELLYKDWYIHVYEPIQMEIFKSMNGDGSRAAYKMERDTKYTTYLSKVNERGCMYQDDFAPEDYDPTSAVKLDANVARRLKDPTNIPQRKALIEENVILSAEQGRLFTLKQLERTKLPVIVNDKQTRDDLTWNDWLLNQFKDVNSTARVRSAKKCMPNKMSPEHIDFNLIANKKFGTPANSYRAAKEKA